MSLVNMTHRVLVPAVLIAALFPTGGCLIISTHTPKVQVDRDDWDAEPTAAPRIQSAEPIRYTPYAQSLDRVLRQQVVVEDELQRRDWKELADELGDWQRYLRRLTGLSETSHDPVLLRDLSNQLQTLIEQMQTAQRKRDAVAIEHLLDDASPLLRRLSNEFPLTEPASRDDDKKTHNL